MSSDLEERADYERITWGAKNFRVVIAAKYEHFSGIKVDSESEIVVTCGSTEAMMETMLSITNPGDKVVIFSPFYENYGADTILSGAEPIYVPLVPPDFTFSVEQLENDFKQGAKALILCNPSNPCGKVFTLEELTAIAEVVKKYDAYVVTDEVYEHIVYAPNRHIYMQSLDGMRERTIVCNSLSKTYSITGWRLGYVIANPEIIDRVKKVHDFLTVGAAAPGSSFFREDVHNLIRFHFAKQDDTLNEAINRLAGLRKAVAEAEEVEWR